MKLPIRKYGDPVLREKCTPVGQVGDELKTLAANMLETMYAANGIGLAAQQIGRTEALFVIDIPPESDVDEEGLRENPDVSMPLLAFNPSVANPSTDLYASEEGCLSFPDINGSITRPAEIDFTYMDQDGATHTHRVRGLLARAVQHELDHLNGVLFIDRMSPVRKIAIGGRLKRMREATQRSLNLR